jgi:hypothetical protein
MEKLFRDAASIFGYGVVPDMKIDRIGYLFKLRYGFDFYRSWDVFSEPQTVPTQRSSP